ncbi:NACHT domain-containing protein [Streptosporangium sp. NPDC051022]|uniref:NACHT domain-containing protein n=1 Tax=Streptosporangium sp. NPDC051022 TaxID=3155752 RepID=UPI003419E14C
MKWKNGSGPWSIFKPRADGNSRQVNFAGGNFGSVYLTAQPPAPVALHQLPMAPSDFTGRAGEEARLMAWLGADSGAVPAPRSRPRSRPGARSRLGGGSRPGGGSAPRMVNLYGPPGTGKSALAISMANRLTADYPDVQLYLDLRTRDGKAADPDDVLAGVLTTLGVPATELPAGLALRSSFYRSLLAGRRTLLVLDNVYDGGQVGPLLPGHSESAVILTSWSALGELPGVRVLALGKLDEQDAAELLLKITRRPAEEAKDPALREVVRLCEGFPLALRIAGGLIKSRPDRSWAELAVRLRQKDGAPRLDRFRSGHLALEKNFETAYADLPPEAAHGFHLIGLAPSAELSHELMGVLLHRDAATAADVIDELVTRQFLQPSSGSAYRMHDLLRAFAERRLRDAEPPAVRQTAVERLVAWSRDRIRSHYLPSFIARHAFLPSLTGLSDLPLDAHYVDGPLLVRMDGGRKVPVSAARVFPRPLKRLAVTGPGGTGKTTLVNSLCLTAARRGAAGGGGPVVPLVLLARDLRPEDDGGDLETLILRTLRYQYDFQTTGEVLSAILEHGHCLLAVDGLDEVEGTRLRGHLVRELRRFSSRYRRVPVLVTTRHYPGVRDDLAFLRSATMAPWPDAQVHEFLEKLATGPRPGALEGPVAGGTPWLASAVRHLIEENPELSDTVKTPLALLMLSEIYARGIELPRSPVKLTECLLHLYVFDREQSRGTLHVLPDQLKLTLSAIAFAMQSNNENRIYFRERPLSRFLRTLPLRDVGPDHAADHMMRYFQSRATIFTEVGSASDGEPVFAFTHTAYREHFAAQYIAALSPRETLRVIADRLESGSWEAVLSAAVELARDHRGPGHVKELGRLAEGADPRTGTFVRRLIARL